MGGTTGEHEQPRDDIAARQVQVAETARLAAALGEVTAQRDDLQRQLAKVRQQNAQLWALALEDPLTGLANRRGLAAVWAHELARSRRYGYPCSVIALDLDRFKLVNDAYGHDEGDRVLCRAARQLTAAVRADDLVARTGGEEFTIILSRADLTAALAVAERVRQALAVADLAPDLGACTFSAGVACSRLTPHAALLPAADRALYRAKANGRDRVEVWPGPLSA
ncbi:MAG TPA: GGDEF domain-containing protein [Chloroflexota bacterium]|jgi:diguanylate cyclase (GGDEF)-like protein